MKGFEVYNRIAWIALVISFLVKKERVKRAIQAAVLIDLIISLILECIGI